MPNTPTISQLKKHIKSTPTYRQNGQMLPKFWLKDWLLFVLGQPNSFLYSHLDYRLSTDEYQRYQVGIEKMQAGTPLAYLLGYQEFWSLKFLVNEHTLIPRPDSEVLVEQTLAWIKHYLHKNSLSKDKQSINSATRLNSNTNQNQYKLLDLGTGTGCLAISLAYELNKIMAKMWQITAVDFCPNALNIAKQNAQLNKVNNIQFMQSDWFTGIAKPKQEQQKFSVIISNPPYIDKADSHLTALTAEPITALVADKQGLADIEIIVKYAPDYLQQGGLLAIEHGFEQGKAVRELLFNQGWQNVRTIKDYGGNERVTMAQWQRL